MQTRRDQLHAYRFLTRRAQAALVAGEPNAVEPPMRRLTLTTVSGIMIAVLVAAGAALVGVIRPSTGSAWKQPGAVIVERETGARYVLLDGRLHPALNYASAALAAGGQQTAHVTLVDRSELRRTPRGVTIGIPGIPDSLPTARSLLHATWSVCSGLRADDTGNVSAHVAVTVGGPVRAAVLPGEGAVYVAAATGGARYLLYRGARLSVRSGDVATALGLQSETPLTVGTAFLDAVPAGPALTTPAVPGLGTPGPTVAGRPTVVGQLLRVADRDQHLVVLPDGVAATDPVQTSLLETLVVRGAHLPVVDIGESDALGLPQSPAVWPALEHQFDGLPDHLPDLDRSADLAGGLCAVYPRAASTPGFAVPSGRPQNVAGAAVVESSESQQGVADEVLVEPGRAALVKSADGAPTVFLVADPGRKYPVASDAALTSLGYASVAPDPVPAVLLPLLRTGPALDPVAARRPVTG